MEKSYDIQQFNERLISRQLIKQFKQKNSFYNIILSTIYKLYIQSNIF